MRARPVSVAAASCALLLLTAGCGTSSRLAGPATDSTLSPHATPGPSASASAVPSATATSAPTPAPTPSSAAGTNGVGGSATIELLPGELRLGGTSRSGQSLAAGDIAGTVSALGALLGEPETSTVTQEQCIRPGTSYAWGGGLNLFAPADGADYEIRLLSDRATGTDGRTVSLAGPGGVRVGADIARLLETTPASHLESYDNDGTTSSTVLLGAVEPGATADQGTTGVAAFTRGTVVTAIGWPVSVHSNADC